MPEKHPENKKWLVLITVMVGTLLIGLDRTVVNLGLPKMIDDFGISVSLAGWIATAYILSNAVFVPVFGKLGDIIGDRKIYLWSFIGFIISSVLAGMAWNISSMIFFRAIQGLVGAAIYPTAMSLIVKNFPDQKARAQALGIWSASFAASAVFGPLIGGPLIDSYSWRMLFYINLPIGILGIFMVLLYLPNDKGKEKGGFDFYGAITLAVALSSLVLVLEKGREWEWTSFNSVLCYALVLIFGFWFIQLEKKHPSPMIDLKFFKNPTFVSALLVSFISFGGMMGAMFLLPIFVQTYLGYDATQTGFLFLPMALGMFVAAPLGAKLAQKIHVRYSVSLGMLLVALAIFLFTGLDARTSATELTLPLIILAVGMGIGMSPLTNAVASSVPTHEVGIASAILNLTRNIAGAVAIALFGTLLSNVMESKVLEVGANTIINDPKFASFVPTLVVLKSQILAYREVFLTASIATAFGAFVALTLRDSSKIKDNHPLRAE
jgi:EmrB/QacA subfamily drug resistance transporter